ncbi:MAG: carboxypeptidase-like regulatory domain-containing protein [Bryobacteraceae bacterium]
MACLLTTSAPFLAAQTAATGTLTGKVLNASGAAVANAKVTAVNRDTGLTQTATTGADGVYRFALPPGNYRVKFETAGFVTAEIPSTTVSVSGTSVLDGKLEASAQSNQPPAAKPAAKPTEPSLNDLGFPADQTAANAAEQMRLDKRSHMLKIHQRLGLITAGALVATLVLSNGAAGRNSTASGRELHAAVGGATAGLYITTASFAIFAPKIAGTKTRGPIRVHKALAFIHGPGMILTPILGALAYEQRSSGQKVHGIASAHGAVGTVTAIAYGAAMLSVVFKF